MTDIKELLQGYKRFHDKYFVSDDRLYREINDEGQSPKTIVIACSDSRVDPLLLIDGKPGEIFVVRNVANLVPPYECDDHGRHGVSAALEFAVCFLEVENIVILGHSNCAGIKALVNSERFEKTDFIGKWMEIAREARERAKTKETQEIYSCCEKEAIKLSLRNLMTFPWINERVETGNLKLYGWYFVLANGSLEEIF